MAKKKILETVGKGTQLINPNLKHILEFGVGNGDSTRLIAKIVSEWWADKDIQIIGFDWFEGLPEDWVSDNDNTLAAPKGAFSQHGKIPEIEGVKFYVGLFDDTIHRYIKAEAQPIALLHVDCDLYSSTKTIFDNLHPYIVEGTIIVFDEWNYLHDEKFNDHEQKAFYEYVEKHNVKFVFEEYVDPRKPVERKIVRIIG